MKNFINTTTLLSVSDPEGFIAASEVMESGAARVILSDDNGNDICIDFHSKEAISVLVKELVPLRDSMESPAESVKVAKITLDDGTVLCCDAEDISRDEEGNITLTTDGITATIEARIIKDAVIEEHFDE